jgi:ribosomal protein S18 acetylase RimI-like enzyme
VNICLATIADAAAIAEIQISAWREGYRGRIPDAVLDALDISEGADTWSRVLSAEHSVMVAVSDSSIVGFCSLRASRDDDTASGTAAEINALYVHPQRWRRGVGRALCSHAFAAAAAAGYSSITLWTLASNSPAIRFYTAVGFVQDGAVKTEQVSSDCMVEELRMRRAIQPPNDRDA